MLSLTQNWILEYSPRSLLEEILEGQEYDVVKQRVELRMKVSPQFQGNYREIGRKIVL